MDKKLIDDNQPTAWGDESQPMTYEHVNHPNHYNNYDIEVIDMMEKIWGPAYLYIWCTLTAFKYRMRMGTKPGEDIITDINKEKWYLDKAAELKEKLNQQKKN